MHSNYMLHYCNIGLLLFNVDTKLQIGILTQQKVKSLVDNGDVAPQKAVKFYRGVRDFFETAADYSLKHLPLDDELLQNASFLSFDKRLDADVLQAEYFVERWAT